MEYNTIQLLESYDSDIFELDISNKNINGILDLKKFKKLIKLECKNNQITRISNLSDKLEYLDCSNNLITSINNGDLSTKISKLIGEKIKYLDCKDNLFEIIDGFYYFILDYFNFSGNPVKTWLYYSKTLPIEYPKTLEKITFVNILREPINNLPAYLKELDLGHNKNFSNLPENLTHLSLSYYDIKTNGKLSNKITHLSLNCDLGIDFDSEFIDNLPENLISLTLDNNFNQPIKKFPKNLKKLIMLGNRNYPINIIDLPNTITELTLGYYFNKSVDNLPTSIEKLILGNYFNQPVNNLPCGIKELTFGTDFNQPVNNLPCGIKELTFGYDFNQPIEHLPVSLEKIFFGSYFNQTVEYLPYGIKELYFGDYFNQNVNYLPNSIIKLCFGEIFNQPVDNLPISIEHIEFGFNFNQPVRFLPPNLKYVEFKKKFNQSIDNLPDSVETIVMSFWEKIIEYDYNCIHVNSDDINLYFEQPINKLPKNLKKFIIIIKRDDKFGGNTEFELNINSLEDINNTIKKFI